MAVQALKPGYTGEVKDRVELFHGNQLLFVGWDQHSMICAPIALPLPPAMPFGDLIDKVLPTTAFAAHPDWPQITWNKVEWLRSGKPFKPDLKKSLADNGLDHKAVVRFRTPKLLGIAGSRS
jgi:phenol/toluene 2-monooxygenase (NADH) P4/A4